MAFTKVSGVRQYFKYNECTPGQVLVEDALYVGQEEGTYGIQHIFRKDDGDMIVLNSSGQLNYLLDENDALGQRCRVLYKGKSTLTGGKFQGKEAHGFDLFIDINEDAKAKVPKPAAAPSEPEPTL